ncbi:MAG: hypothetical protein GTN59_11745 [Candidatus Dadabacteria bacterium]|nr:hypothetical protein [Candidatus Dadabacteria bacterium]
MKVLNIIILLFFSAMLSSSFTPVEPTRYPIGERHSVNQKQYNSSIYVDWKVSGSGYWSNNDYYYIYNDFMYMISRSDFKINNYYYFDIWLFSESYYWDGSQATYTSTNIKYVTVYVNGYVSAKNTNSLGVTFFDEAAPKSLRVKSQSKNPRITFSWKEMKAM